MAKVVQVSVDDTTYYTLPGSTGGLSNEASAIDDTVFGNTFSSTQAGLNGWTIEGQAYYKGFAGYVAKILKAGTPTAMTTEPMSQVGATLTYRVTAPAKRVLDPADTYVINDDGTPVDAEDIANINYLFGEVTFVSGYTVAGAITITGDYLPTAVMGKANSYTLQQTAEAVETTDFNTAQGNNGHRTFQPGLRTVQLELGGFYDVANGFKALLTSRATVIVEINPDGSGKSLARGFFQLTAQDQSGDVGALEEESVTLALQVPSSDYVPFGWHHESDTTLHQSVRTCLAAWIDEESLFVRYLYDGTNGMKGEAIVTEVSMSGGLDDMNEFTANFQGSGVTTVVGTG